MSINTFFAMLVGVGLFMGAIVVSTENYWVFISGSSAVIVLGGTLASTFLSFEFRYVIGSLKAILGTFSVHRLDRASLNAEVGRVIRWAYMVQKDGIIALEAEAKNTPGWDGGFLLFGVELILTGYNGEETRRILSNTIESTYERSLLRVGILRNMASTAPAFGMIGTLVGLIVMLDTMGDDPNKIGAGMAVALLTTLYGVLLARLIFAPAGAKVQQREDVARFRNYLIVDGLAMLADKASPRHIQDRMNSYLDPTIRYDIDTQLKGDAQATSTTAKA